MLNSAKTGRSIVNFMIILGTFVLWFTYRSLSKSVLSYIIVFLYGLFVFANVRYFQDIMFTVRTSLLAVPGILTFVGVIVFNVDVSFSFHKYQTVTNALCIQFITLIGLSSSTLGWQIGIRRAKNAYLKSRFCSSIDTFVRRFDFRLLFGTFIVVAIFCGWQNGRALGRYLWIDPYRAGLRKSTVLNIQMYSHWSIGALLAAYSIYRIYLKDNSIYRYVFVFSTLHIVLFQGLLKGARLEAISFLFAFGALYLVFEIKKFSLFKFIWVSILILPITQILGYIRTRWYSEGLKKEFLSAASVLFTPSQQGHIIFARSTVSPVNRSLFRIIGDINSGISKYLYGRTYLDYILRTPPQFIYPNRPGSESVGWKYVGHAEWIFELAEAYLNFSVYGCFLVPFIISFILARFFYGRIKYKKFRNWFDYALYALMTSSLFRGIWYQNFALYKITIASLILWTLLLIVNKMLLKVSK